MLQLLFNYELWVCGNLIQAFLDLGELLISSDTGAALDAFKTVTPVFYNILDLCNWVTLMWREVKKSLYSQYFCPC